MEKGVLISQQSTINSLCMYLGNDTIKVVLRVPCIHVKVRFRGMKELPSMVHILLNICCYMSNSQTKLFFTYYNLKLHNYTIIVRTFTNLHTCQFHSTKKLYFTLKTLSKTQLFCFGRGSCTTTTITFTHQTTTRRHSLQYNRQMFL